MCLSLQILSHYHCLDNFVYYFVSTCETPKSVTQICQTHYRLKNCMMSQNKITMYLHLCNYFIIGKDENSLAYSLLFYENMYADVHLNS